MKFKETEFGNIPIEWGVDKVKNVTSLVTDYVSNGSFASLAKNVTYLDKETKNVLIRLVDYNNDFKGPFVYIDDDAYEFLSKSKLYGDEIIISNVGANVGTVFKCPRLKYRMSLAPNSIVVKFKGDNDFYYYWLMSHSGQHMLRSIVTGSAQPKFNKTNFKDMNIPIPPINTQKQIATLLVSIDKKIELNNKINDNLLSQANNIYEEFVKEKKLNGKLKDIIVENKKSKIQVGVAKDIKGSYPFFTSGQSILQYNDFLVDGRNIYLNTGGNADVKFYIGKAAYSTDTWCINGDQYTDYLYLYFHKILNEIELVYFEGSALKHLKKKKLLEKDLYIPNENDIILFNEMISPIFDLINFNLKNNQKLSELRDTLLPKLMSGEIDVSNIKLEL